MVQVSALAQLTWTRALATGSCPGPRLAIGRPSALRSGTQAGRTSDDDHLADSALALDAIGRSADPEIVVLVRSANRPDDSDGVPVVGPVVVRVSGL